MVKDDELEWAVSSKMCSILLWPRVQRIAHHKTNRAHKFLTPMHQNASNTHIVSKGWGQVCLPPTLDLFAEIPRAIMELTDLCD